MPPDQGHQRISLEQSVEVLLPQFTEEIVEEFKTVPQEQFSERTCGQIVVRSTKKLTCRIVLVPPIMEDIAAGVHLTPRERGQGRVKRAKCELLRASGRGADHGRGIPCATDWRGRGASTDR